MSDRPPLRENHFVVHMRGLPGTSLPQSLAAGARVSDDLRAVKGVRGLLSRCGADPEPVPAAQLAGLGLLA